MDPAQLILKFLFAIALLMAIILFGYKMGQYEARKDYERKQKDGSLRKD